MSCEPLRDLNRLRRASDSVLRTEVSRQLEWEHEMRIRSPDVKPPKESK